MWRLLVCLALGACGQDGPVSPVQVAGVGTLASGDAVVLLRQTWQTSGGANAIYEKIGGLLVHGDGTAEATMLPAPLLAPDCSDATGACIASTKTMSGEVSTWTFALGDGTQLVATDAATTESATRVAADGTALWTLYGVARPDNTIRDGTLLVINARYASASKITVENGAALWTVAPPPRL